MTHEQFTFWLKGFIESKEQLSESDIETIQIKMDVLYPDVFIQTTPNSPWNQVWSVPYYYSGQPVTITGICN